MKFSKLLCLALLIVAFVSCDSAAKEGSKALSAVGVTRKEQREINEKYIQPVSREMADGLGAIGLHPEQVKRSVGKAGKKTSELGDKTSRSAGKVAGSFSGKTSELSQYFSIGGSESAPVKSTKKQSALLVDEVSNEEKF